MKSYQFNLNIGLLSLFIMFCIANSLIIDNNNIFKGNNILSKPETINLIRIYQMKKVAQDEIKVLKSKRDKIDKSMKRLSNINKDGNDINIGDPIANNFFNNNLSLMISLSALCIGFIFAGVFLMMAYLLSEYYKLNFS